MVQRRVRQHHAQGGIAWCELWRQRCGLGRGATLEQDNGPFTAREEAGLFLIDAGIMANRVEVPHHQSEWLVNAALASSQLPHRFVVGGVAGQVKSADALDRDNPS